MDVQNKRINPDELKHFLPEDEPDYEPSPEDVDYIIKSLRNAQRPAILIGSGVRLSGAIKELEHFIEKTSIPVSLQTQRQTLMVQIIHFQ